MQYNINGRMVDCEIGDMVKPLKGAFPIDPISECSTYAVSGDAGNCPLINIFSHYDIDGMPIYIETCVDAKLIESIWRKL